MGWCSLIGQLDFPVAVTGSTISGNSAAGGGGIQVDDGVTMTLANSTVSGNTATSASGGGGIRTDPPNGSSPGTASLTNVTVAANAAPSGTGAGLRNNGTINVKNTIVSGNAGANCAGSGTMSKQSNNLEDGTSCGLNINANPLLQPLADNGGDTQTHAIPLNSPAINAAGSCPPPTTDQRGVDRPQGGACDIGSYEFVPSKTLPSVPDCSPDGQITLAMDPPAGETPVAFKFKIDDGPTQTAQTDDDIEQISLPGEGRFKLEYWSQTSAGEEPQASHLVDTAIVDMTEPDGVGRERPEQGHLRDQAQCDRHGAGRRCTERPRGESVCATRVGRHRLARLQNRRVDGAGQV